MTVQLRFRFDSRLGANPGVCVAAAALTNAAPVELAAVVGQDYALRVSDQGALIAVVVHDAGTDNADIVDAHRVLKDGDVFRIDENYPGTPVVSLRRLDAAGAVYAALTPINA